MFAAFVDVCWLISCSICDISANTIYFKVLLLSLPLLTSVRFAIRVFLGVLLTLAVFLQIIIHTCQQHYLFDYFILYDSRAANAVWFVASKFEHSVTASPPSNHDCIYSFKHVLKWPLIDHQKIRQQYMLGSSIRLHRIVPFRVLHRRYDSWMLLCSRVPDRTQPDSWHIL